MSDRNIKIGTRGSDLALFQTRQVIGALKRAEIPAVEDIIKTRGDADYRPFTQISGDGFFTKEIERSLHENSVQMAVHSSKDLPSMIHEDLPWKAFGEREEAVDILIVKKGVLLEKNPLTFRDGARIGTSSPRRLHQLHNVAPEVEIVNLRGNVPTRIERVVTGDLDGAILAKAGVKRLGLLDGLAARGVDVIELNWVTAPCQGIMAVQSNKNGAAALNRIANHILDPIAKAEKSILALLGGGCHLPVGARIDARDDQFDLRVFYADESMIFEFSSLQSSLAAVLRRFIQEFVGSENSGPRVWLTQPIQHVIRPARVLAKSGFTPVVWPLTEVVPCWKNEDLQKFFENRERYAGVAFSSQFAVQIFITECAAHFDVADWLNGKKVFAVGGATKRKLEGFGVHNVIVADEAHAESLKETILKHKLQGPLLLPGQSESVLTQSADDFKNGLETLVLYRVRAAEGPLTDIPELGRHDHLVLTSPSAAREFAKRLHENADLKTLKVWAFGPSTSRELKALDIPHQTNSTSGSWETLISDISRSN